MIQKKEVPDKKENIEKLLHPYVKQWFFSRFKEFSLPQLYGVIEVHSRNNVLVSAPTGATKCLTPDETVLVNQNGFVKLVNGKTLIEESKQGQLITKFEETGELREIKDLKAYCFQNNCINLNKAFIYGEFTKDKLLKIKTEYGREVKISKEHPLLVEGKGWVHSKDLIIGDKIACPKEIQLPEHEINLNVQEAIKVLRKKVRLCLIYEDYIRLKIKTKDFSTLSKLSTLELQEILLLISLNYSTLSKKINSCPSQVYQILNKKTNYKSKNFEEILLSRLKRVYFERNRILVKTYGNSKFSFMFPNKVDVPLARWLSFFLAEGLIGDYKKGTQLMITQKNRKDLLTEFFSTAKKYFDINFKAQSEKDYSFNSTAFCYFITALFEIKMGRGRYIEFPQWILNAKKEIKNNFLQVFFALEATITRKEIQLTQANKQKIEIINYLLLSEGILCSLNKSQKFATNTINKTKREYYSITIQQISNLRRFREIIGIDHHNQWRIIKHCEKKSSGNYVNKFKFDYKKIRNLSKYFKSDKPFLKELGSIYEVVRRTNYITIESLKKLKIKIQKINPQEPLLKEIDIYLESKIVWLEIKEITEFEYEGLVFDLNVPDIHNFIGGFGGIILHNTLTSFLSIINELVDCSEKGILKDKIYAIYVSPLKALNRDIEKNLLEPLEEINKIAGKDLGIRVGVRTGDTTQAEKQRMLKHVPHILITTPESLSILLSSKRFSENMKQIDWAIIDEIHSIADNKRGVHLSLTLEQLQRLSPGMCRIGLSATVAPLEEVAKFLVGDDRKCKIIDVQFLKEMDLEVLSAVDDLVSTSYEAIEKDTYALMDKLIQSHKTTLIFTNTRAGTERVVHHLKTRFPEKYKELDEDSKEVRDLIGAHHGSLSKEHRLKLENDLRDGKLKCVVCSTSLELGLDIGYIDLVICLGSPKSVARFLQRSGRAGHKLHDKVVAKLLINERDDLVECSVLLKYANEKKMDRIHIPTNCLDVLAQQVMGMALEEIWDYDDMFKTIKNAYCYRDLSKKDFDEILDYLAGNFTSLEDRHIYARIWWDKEAKKIGKKGRMSRTIYMTNIGTIPDQQGVVVKDPAGNKIGMIDEMFLEKLDRGDIFVLGGNTYQFSFARGMVAQVIPMPGKKPTVPSWYSDRLPLSYDLAKGIGDFRYLMEEKFKRKVDKKEIISFINKYLYVNDTAAEALYNYFKDQYDYIGIPSSKKMIIEHYRDDQMKNYVIFHSLYGRRVNEVLSRALGLAITRSQHKDVEIGVSDNGFYVVFNKSIDVMKSFKLLKSKELRKVLELAIDKSEILKRRFRHCAGRAMMILRNYGGVRKRVGRQQVSSTILLNSVKRISENFFILRETRREILEDLMDFDSALEVLKNIENKEIEIEEVQTFIPSPFALNLVMQGYSDILRMEDRQKFLQRMHQMVKAKIALKKR